MFNEKNFSIRALESDDKNRILQWRNSERVRCNMYSDHLISESEHDAWFSRALVDSSARYLIFLYKNNPVGFISFTAINHFNERCYWAFYLGETDTPTGIGSIMEFFALEYAFLTLNMRKLSCEVFEFNRSVVKLHEKFGFIHEGKLLAHYLKNGKYEDITCLAKFKTAWLDEREQFKSRLFGKTGN